MITYISIFITAIFVNNIVLAQFLGICPFLGVSKKVNTALGMGAAVTFVMTIATIVTYLLQKYLLDITIYANHSVYSGYCSTCTDGRNYT